MQGATVTVEVEGCPEAMHESLVRIDGFPPGNVLLNKAETDSPEVKLGDFGLSRMQQLTTQPTMNPDAGTVRCEPAPGHE